MAKFKVGDKVRIKPMSEIRLNDEHCDPESGLDFDNQMSVFCGTTLIVSKITPSYIELSGGSGNIGKWRWAPNWLEPVSKELRILPGYAIKTFHMDGTSFVWLASMTSHYNVCVVKADGTWNIARCKSDIMYAGSDIVRVEVYGYTRFAHLAFDFSVNNRDLLWIWEREKPTPKKMTVKEICKALGYDVEIVKEADSDA